MDRKRITQKDTPLLNRLSWQLFFFRVRTIHPSPKKRTESWLRMHHTDQPRYSGATGSWNSSASLIFRPSAGRAKACTSANDRLLHIRRKYSVCRLSSHCVWTHLFMEFVFSCRPRLNLPRNHSSERRKGPVSSRELKLPSHGATKSNKSISKGVLQ